MIIIIMAVVNQAGDLLFLKSTSDISLPSILVSYLGLIH